MTLRYITSKRVNKWEDITIQTRKNSILVSFILTGNAIFVALGEGLINEVKYLCENFEVKEGRGLIFGRILYNIMYLNIIHKIIPINKIKGLKLM